jgi:hypothetical protein
MSKHRANRNGAQPQNPVVVHNMPFFHHPLVQQYNQQQNNPVLDDENETEPLKTVPLHIPVPPEAFLKFFSL